MASASPVVPPIRAAQIAPATTSAAADPKLRKRARGATSPTYRAATWLWPRCPARLPSVGTGLLSRDDELLSRLQAPPDLSDGLDSLAYWRGRRERLPWYRRRAKREAARMVVVWERRVRAAMLRQRRASLASRLLAARLLASRPLRRSARRAGFAVAATAFVVVALAPAVLVVSVLLKLF